MSRLPQQSLRLPRAFVCSACSPKLIEVSREYKLPLCLTFIDLKKTFDSVETEAAINALLTQDVPTQYIRVLRELYSGFTTKISPFYNDVVIDVKRR
ncbi:unnamed protein product, partial [Heligmosomoides polygyrus]|uniref:Reverse transcriptase domain-containing protein n=1 Tax=Heligmosomoides polygyrus TaxID=6339 RepID=A0A183GWT1_HELPZ